MTIRIHDFLLVLLAVPIYVSYADIAIRMVIFLLPPIHGNSKRHSISSEIDWWTNGRNCTGTYLIKHVESCPHTVARGQVRTCPSLPVCFYYCTLIFYRRIKQSNTNTHINTHTHSYIILNIYNAVRWCSYILTHVHILYNATTLNLRVPRNFWLQNLNQYTLLHKIRFNFTQ